jgi:hypothetical protein
MAASCGALFFGRALAGEWWGLLWRNRTGRLSKLVSNAAAGKCNIGHKKCAIELLI